MCVCVCVRVCVCMCVCVKVEERGIAEQLRRAGLPTAEEEGDVSHTAARRVSLFISKAKAKVARPEPAVRCTLRPSCAGTAGGGSEGRRRETCFLSFFFVDVVGRRPARRPAHLWHVHGRGCGRNRRARVRAWGPRYESAVKPGPRLRDGRNGGGRERAESKDDKTERMETERRAVS